jgi:hypothetical protein
MNSSLFEARRIFALSSEANPLKRIEKVTRLLLSEGLLQDFHARGAEKNVKALGSGWLKR